MTTVIRKMVQDICMSKDDPLSTKPEEVLQAIYKQGLMNNMMQEMNNQCSTTSSPPQKSNFISCVSEDLILQLDSNSYASQDNYDTHEEIIHEKNGNESFGKSNVIIT